MTTETTTQKARAFVDNVHHLSIELHLPERFTGYEQEMVYNPRFSTHYERHRPVMDTQAATSGHYEYLIELGDGASTNQVNPRGHPMWGKKEPGAWLLVIDYGEFMHRDLPEQSIELVAEGEVIEEVTLQPGDRIVREFAGDDIAIRGS